MNSEEVLLDLAEWHMQENDGKMAIVYFLGVNGAGLRIAQFQPGSAQPNALL